MQWKNESFYWQELIVQMLLKSDSAVSSMYGLLHRTGPAVISMYGVQQCRTMYVCMSHNHNNCCGNTVFDMPHSCYVIMTDAFIHQGVCDIWHVAHLPLGLLTGGSSVCMYMYIHTHWNSWGVAVVLQSIKLPGNITHIVFQDKALIKSTCKAV